MSTTLPDPIVYGTVIGRLIAATTDSADADDLPDASPMAGTVTFTPSTSAVLLGTAVPPTTLVPKPITVALDANGAFSVKLVATDIADATPTAWTYTVSFNLTGAIYKAFSLSVPAGDTVDITTAAPVPSAAGTVTVVSIADRLAAQAAAADAIDAAASLEVGVAGGVAALDIDGDVVDATGTKVLGGADLTSYATQVADLPDYPTAFPVADGAVALAKLSAALQASIAKADASLNQAEVDARAQLIVDAVVASAPGALDTLNELAAALGDDANFASTVTTALAGKVPTTRTVAGKALDADVALAPVDVGLDAVVVEYLAAGWPTPLPTITGTQYYRFRSVRVVPGDSATEADLIAAPDPYTAYGLSADGHAWLPHPASAVYDTLV
ncbi:hypothetical protein OEB99_16455 [Actinotalea sp. M2MS4P-6]|uniref:hypothetical protein n=1 Tax=Actinotalea sp. M2MS4P-6 TaxID=2983762 RepID=UPI0021E3BA9E|nr:hypothetical protein [Actinotalea sp. M2MS4P-6]MCV2395908.1 hypothetical protein [Actinotalea sp. M2MS4P-6]